MQQLWSDTSNFAELAKSYTRATIDEHISPLDDMFDQRSPDAAARYFGVGRSAVKAVLRGLMMCEKADVKTILDMPCGFGRVMRHLRALFPAAAITGCDLYENRITFCAAQFGAAPFRSREDFDSIQFDQTFDLIWCGSLLTHLPRGLFSKALGLFSRSLAPGGVAVVTTHGRYSPFIHHNRWRYMDDALFEVAEAGFQATGFGYADYRMQDVFNEQETYGISLSMPSYVMRLLESDESLTIRGFTERGWDEHQDVVVFQKLPITAER